MFSCKRGTQVLAKRYLLALLVSTAIVGGASISRAEDGLVDVRTLPRIEGTIARMDDAKYPNLNTSYFGPGSVADTIANTGKLLATDGWIAYTPPFEGSERRRWYKKGAHGVSVSFMTDGSRTDRSGVSYSSQRLEVNLPFPDRATDIVYDERRPYLGCTTAETVDTTLAFFQKELALLGWSSLSATDAEARWPDAKIDEPIPNGLRAYFTRGNSRQLPVMLTLQRGADNKTNVEVRVAPFALPQDLTPGPESAGLPRPERIKSAGTTGSTDSIKREAHALIPAELGPVLAFYRRELGKKGWIEQSKDTVVGADRASLAFTSPEETATMQIGRRYDLTTVQIDVQVLPSVIAARAKAKKEADNRFMKDALALGQSLIAEADAKGTVQAARGPETALRAMDNSGISIPVPDTASDIDFGDGRLAFSSSSSVKALVDFYRVGMKTLGWKTTPSVISNPNMAVLNFSKAGQTIALTAMQMGPKANVTATGSGVKGAPVAAAGNTTTTTGDAKSADKSTEQALESDGDTDYPTPKQRTSRSLGTSGLPGGAPFRHELSASIPAGLDSVLAFYRRELTQLQWQEDMKGAVVKPDSATLVFKAPDGPAMLKLERRKDETTVSLVVRHPTAATKAGVLPAPGKVRLLFGNMGDAEVSVSVNNKTIKVAAGAGGPAHPNGPTMELLPGTYKVTIKSAGKPVHDSTLKVAANDSWGLMVGPDGQDMLPIQLY